MANIVDTDKDFFEGIKELERRYNLSYSIMDYIDFRTHPEYPVIFKAGLDGKIRDEVIVLGNRIVKI